MITGRVLVMNMAAPLATPSMPRVTRNDGMPARVVSRPLSMPTNPPVRIPKRAPTTQLSANCCIASPETTPQSATTEPTERSNSPAMMTIVIPTARMDTNVVCRRMFVQFSGDRKTGDQMGEDDDEQGERHDEKRLAGDAARARHVVEPLDGSRGLTARARVCDHA